MDKPAQKPDTTDLAVERTDLASERTNLAYERTALANDRTLMAWIRTATSLISFGFTIYKFFQEMVGAGRFDPSKTLMSPREVGLTLILFGFLGLLFAVIQYYKDMKRLKKSYDKLPRTFTPVLAMLILLFGLLLFLATLFRQ